MKLPAMPKLVEKKKAIDEAAKEELPVTSILVDEEELAEDAVMDELPAMSMLVEEEKLAEEAAMKLPLLEKTGSRSMDMDDDRINGYVDAEEFPVELPGEPIKDPNFFNSFDDDFDDGDID